MQRNQAQRHRTARPSGEGTPAHRAASRRPRPGRVARGRRRVSAGRKNRRSLLFYVLVGSVCAQVAAAYAGMVSLLALFTLGGLLLSAVAIHAEG